MPVEPTGKKAFHWLQVLHYLQAQGCVINGSFCRPCQSYELTVPVSFCVQTFQVHGTESLSKSCTTGLYGFEALLWFCHAFVNGQAQLLLFPVFLQVSIFASCKLMDQYIYIYIYILFLYLFKFVYIYICIKICIYIYIYIYIDTWIYIYIDIWIYIYICINVYKYMNIYIYVYICIYKNKFIFIYKYKTYLLQLNKHTLSKNTGKEGRRHVCLIQSRHGWTVAVLRL